MNNDPAEHAIVDYRGVTTSFEAVTPEDYIGRLLRESGRFYELEFLESLAEVVNPGETVVDVGANIGNHTLFLARHSKCNVIAYEPVRDTAATLRRNVARNEVEHLVEVRERALGSRRGTMVIGSYDAANVGGTTLEYKDDGDIQVSRLDDEQFPNGISLIKIDAEGMDADVIKGAVRTIGEFRPVVAAEAMDEAGRQELAHLMESLGYTQAGIFNATATYLFLPSTTPQESAKLLHYLGKAICRLEQGHRSNEAKLSTAGRYTERLHGVALKSFEQKIAELTETMQTQSTHSEAMVPAAASAYKTRMEKAEEREKKAREELRKVRDNHLLLAASRDLLNKDLEKRSLIEKEIHDAEREQLQRRVTELESEIRNARTAFDAQAEEHAAREAETLNAAARLKSQLAESAERESKILDTATDLESQVAELSQANTRLVDRIAALDVTQKTMSTEMLELRRELAAGSRLLAKREAYGHDKARRLETALQVLREERSKMRSLQESSSLAIGRLVTKSCRNPWSALALIWRLPKGIAVEYKKHAGVK